jgi:hypothetical protein
MVLYSYRRIENIKEAAGLIQRLKCHLQKAVLVIKTEGKTRRFDAWFYE